MNCQIRLISFVILTLFLFNFENIAIADGLTIEQYQIVRDDPRIKSYLSGVAEGLITANALLESQKQHRLFCPPAEIVLNVENAYQMIDATLKSYPALPPKTTYISGILLLKLQHAFPCHS